MARRKNPDDPQARSIRGAAREYGAEPGQKRQKPSTPTVSKSVRDAFEKAEQVRRRREEIVADLTSAKNPETGVFVPRSQGRAVELGKRTPAGVQRQAAAIRASSNAQKMIPVGREQKAKILAELSSGPKAERLVEVLSEPEQRIFQKMAEAISRFSNQTVGIYFTYEGGLNEYHAVLDRLLGSPDNIDTDDALNRLGGIVDRLGRAEQNYGIRAQGVLRI